MSWLMIMRNCTWLLTRSRVRISREMEVSRKHWVAHTVVNFEFWEIMDLEASCFPWLRLGVTWQQGSFNPGRARWTSKAGKAKVTASEMQKLQLLSCRMPQSKATVKDSKCLMVHFVFWRKMLRLPDADMEYDVRLETQSVLSTLSQDDMIPRVEMDRMISCVEVWTYIMHWRQYEAHKWFNFTSPHLVNKMLTLGKVGYTDENPRATQKADVSKRRKRRAKMSLLIDAKGGMFQQNPSMLTCVH